MLALSVTPLRVFIPKLFPVLFAYSLGLQFAIFRKLQDTAILIGVIKLDVDCPALMDVDNID